MKSKLFGSSNVLYCELFCKKLCRCGQCSDNWLLGDDVASSAWHKLDCDFINGRDTTNIPISKYKYCKTITYIL